MGRAWNPRPQHEQTSRGLLRLLKAGLGLLLAIGVVAMIVIVPAIVQGPIRSEQGRSYQVTPSLAVLPCISDRCSSSLPSNEPPFPEISREPTSLLAQTTETPVTPIALATSTRTSSGSIMLEWLAHKQNPVARTGFLQRMTDLARDRGRSQRP